MKKIKSWVRNLLEGIKKRFSVLMVDVAEFTVDHPFIAGLTEGVWIVYLAIIFSSWLPKNRGKVLDWVDKV